jgi:DNA-binding transcriptional LysR family regulator
MMDLRHLRHALALAELGHYGRAAKACHISQPALSRSIQTLETSLGVKLFDRGRDGVEATQFGHILLRHASGLNIAAKELEREVMLARGLEMGELTIGVGPYGGAALVGPVVAKLNQQFPKLRIEIIALPWRELPERIRTRKVDIVVAELGDIAGLDDLDSVSLSPHPALVICRAGHPLSKQAKILPADLFSYPMAGPILPPAFERQLIDIAPKELLSALQKNGILSIQCDSFSILKTIVMNSDAISMMNHFMLQVELAQGNLISLPVLGMKMEMRYCAAWLSGRTVSTAAAAFVKILQQEDLAAATLASL